MVAILKLPWQNVVNANLKKFEWLKDSDADDVINISLRDLTI